MGFRLGNLKLGQTIANYALPASETCPGETRACASVCYAKHGNFLRPNVQKAHAANLRQTSRSDFVSYAVTALEQIGVSECRIHTGGDFYDREYTEKWDAIIGSLPNITFWTYTRSWRDKEIYPALLQMRRHRNLDLWWSCDRDTGKPPRVKRVRLAYLMLHDGDRPGYHVDLLFRDNDRTTLPVVTTGRTGKKTPVCLYERGPDLPQIGCSRCKLCFNRAAKRVRVAEKLVET